MKAKVNFDGIWMPSVDLVIYSYALNERIKRSLKLFFILLAFAVFSILIPVLHFVLVPMFLILSLVLSLRKFKETKKIDFTGTVCPKCKIDLKTGILSLKEDDKTVRLNCDNCRKSLTIVIEDDLI